MTHLLAMGGRDRADDAEDLVRLNSVPDQVQVDMTYYSVPNDAAFLKHFTPLYITSNGAKAQYMWASREFESQRSCDTFPAYMVTGFGLLDAFVHAYATNSTLVLHPLDIVLSVCYSYGCDRKRPIYHNNVELRSHVQIALKQEFTRSNLLLAMIARLSRRVETFPLPKLYSLINTEMSSPDPLVVRLVLGVLNYLATTREATRLTLDQFKSLFDLQKSSKAEQLMDSQIPTRVGVIDVKHDPSVPVWWKAGQKCSISVPVVQEGSAKQDSDAATEDAGNIPAASPVFGVVPVVTEPPSQSLDPNQNGIPNHQDQTTRRDKAADLTATAATATAATAAAIVTSANGRGRDATDVVGATDDMKISGGNWQQNFDADSTDADVPEETGREDDSPSRQTKPGQATKAGSRNALDGFNFVNSDTVGPKLVSRDGNNSNFAEEQEAAEWFLKPRTPSLLYKIRKENGIHSVLFKGNQTAWLELPEILHELCQFFMLDSVQQTKIIDIALAMQKTRLNVNRSYRKWWQKALFKEGSPEPLPDGDYLINGWLAQLLGERLVAEQCPMTLNKLSDLKTSVKLPMLLIHLPANSMEDTDDAVLELDTGTNLTRLQFYDEFREKLVNSSSNANDVPVGLFMPWRSSDALVRTRKLWREVDGDSPALQPKLGSRRIKAANNRNNVETHASYVSTLENEQTVIPDEEVTIKTWTGRRQSSRSRKTGMCSCCGRRSGRRASNVTEPLYNMSCLISGVGGFCIEQPYDLAMAANLSLRTRVRPICFVDIAHEE